MFGNSVVVLLLWFEALRLPSYQRRAIGGVIGMTLVLFTAGVNLILLALFTHDPGEDVSLVFLPLTSSSLIMSLSTLAFPVSPPSFARAERRRCILLFSLSVCACFTANSLALLDLLFYR